jgi:energy-coupling factor transporter ATP-binding protein EcfA2
LKSLHFTEEEQNEHIKKNATVEIHSGYSFLNAHRGLRRGSTHIVMGTPGGGKSTLVRSLVRDFIFRKENLELGLSIQLSEETTDEYKGQLVFGMPPADTLMRGALIAEEEHTGEDFDYFLDQHRAISPDLLVYDNLTTSRFYEGATPKEQAAIFTKIKNLTKELNCATVIVAHTSADIHDGIERFINQTDIRGSKNVPNMAEFFYILQRFKEGDTFYPTIRTVKHRSQELIHDMYFLQYEKSTRSYIKDFPITFEQFKEAFSKRQRLTK